MGSSFCPPTPPVAPQEEAAVGDRGDLLEALGADSAAPPAWQSGSLGEEPGLAEPFLEVKAVVQATMSRRRRTWATASSSVYSSAINGGEIRYVVLAMHFNN